MEPRPGIRLLEQPLAEGWVYPCALQDVAARLARFPGGDLDGLCAVGLAAATRRDHSADGRYVAEPKPTIYLYAYPAQLVHKLPAHTRGSEIQRGLATELSYGMVVESAGSRYVCRWELDDLRASVLGYVLAHEIGHHVYHYGRQRRGYVARFDSLHGEQFADAYARRHAAG